MGDRERKVYPAHRDIKQSGPNNHFFDRQDQEDWHRRPIDSDDFPRDSRDRSRGRGSRPDFERRSHYDDRDNRNDVPRWEQNKNIPAMEKRPDRIPVDRPHRISRDPIPPDDWDTRDFGPWNGPRSSNSSGRNDRRERDRGEGNRLPDFSRNDSNNKREQYAKPRDDFVVSSSAKSRSRSRDKRPSKRSKTRSRSRERSPENEWLRLKAQRAALRASEKRDKLWDKAPEGTEAPLGPQIPGMLNITPQLLQATIVAANPQQTRQARRLYVGNIPAGISELAIAQFFNANLQSTGKCSSIPPVSNVQIHAEKAFAFLEFVRVEDATLCMLLDGIVFENQKVKVRRPKDYAPIPGLPSNPEDLAGHVVLPGVVSTNVRDTPYKVYLGNLPTHLTDAQVQTLVSAFGALRSFHLVTEAGSSVSKGFCFFEYADPSATAPAVQGLSGLQLGDKNLTCSFANADKAIPAVSLATAEAGSLLLGALPANGLTPVVLPTPTCVLRLGNMVTESELSNDEEHADILVDVKEEMCSHGTVLDVKIPRPESGEETGTTAGSGVGYIFVHFSTPEEALVAYKAMTGRQFGGKTVLASFFDEARFVEDDLS